MRTHVADHPLIAHKLTALRDERTDSPTFRRLADELVTLLAYEATRDVRTEAVQITTPVATTTGVRLAAPKPLVVPILLLAHRIGGQAAEINDSLLQAVDNTAALTQLNTTADHVGIIVAGLERGRHRLGG